MPQNDELRSMYKIKEKLKVPDARWRVPDTSYLFYLSLVNKLLLLRKR